MLRIHLFQTLTLTFNNHPFPFTVLPKTYSLLAYLLLHADRPVSREQIAALLWGDVTDKQARANLRRHLHNLTKSLPENDTPWIIRSSKSVQWNPDAPYWVDTAAFEQAAHNTEQLAQAAALYQGDLLPELYDEWLNIERERLKKLYLTVLQQLAEQYEHTAEYHKALKTLEQLLQVDPFNEAAVLRTMHILCNALHDRPAALQTYHQFRALLERELGVEPLEEITTLFNEISTNRQAPPTINTPPHNLPAPLTRFIGRTQELTLLHDLLHTAAVRLITITGMAGSGKTRLSLTFAHQLLAQPAGLFPDGIYFVELAPVHQPAQVTQTIVEALGVEEKSGRVPQEQLIASLQDKQLLLILDNFEHLLPAADLLHVLLTALPQLTLLVTSQMPLQLYGEREFPLAPLQLPDENTRLETNTAVTLFVDRVQAVQPTLTLSEDNGQTIAAICRRLDGIPLAIELAAARSKHFSLPKLLAQLDDRLNFLSSTRRNAPARQQTLRAAIDWSYQLLDIEEQELFKQLTVFASSITVEAAAAISEATRSAIEPQLFNLVEKNMLQRLPTPPNEPRRLAMLSVLREYGLEKLQANEQQWTTTQHRFAHYYVSQVEVAKDHLVKREQDAWLRWVKWESLNLNALNDYLLQQAQDGQPALLLRFVLAMENIWEFQGRITIAKERLEQALAYRDELSVSKQILLLNKCGGMSQWVGEYAVANDHHQAALQLARRGERDRDMALTLHYLGINTGRQGHYDQARQFLEESLALTVQLPDAEHHETGPIMNNLAIVYKRLGLYAQAEEILLKVIDTRRTVGDQLGVASSLSTLGGLALEQNNLRQAAVYLQESLQIRYELDDVKGLLSPLHHLAILGVKEQRWAYSTILFGFCACQREQMAFQMSADFQADFDQATITLRAQLEPSQFEQLWREGVELSLKAAVEFAQTSAVYASNEPKA